MYQNYKPTLLAVLCARFVRELTRDGYAYIDAIDLAQLDGADWSTLLSVAIGRCAPGEQVTVEDVRAGEDGPVLGRCVSVVTEI